MPDMDIVFIGKYCQRGIIPGPEKVAKRIFSEYTINNQSIFIEYFFDGKVYSVFKKLFGKEESKNEKNAVILRLGLIRIFFLLLKINPRIIHIITFERFALIAFAAKIFIQSKIFYSVHGIIIHENKYFRKIKWYYNLKDKITEDIFIKYSDALLVLSNNLCNLMLSYYQVNKKRIYFVKNGIDEAFKRNIEITKQINNKLKIVYISDIRRVEKGFSFLKETLELLDTEVELYIIDSIYKKSESIFKNKNINTFCFDKMDPDSLSEFIRDKDVFILASLYEPFSISTVECMSAGLIPIVTEETGASELIENGKNGFIIKYGDSEKLISILMYLIANTKERKNISIETSKIYTKLAWGSIINSYKQIYKTFL